ncbi:MAG: hypothetical protein AB7I59_18180 [Geminicoccaceae bacterium]
MSAYEYLVRFSEPLTPTSWNYIASTHGRSTAGGDTPASRHVPPTLAAPPTFQLSIFDGIEPVLNPRGSIGGVVLLDPKGVLDNLLFGVLDGGILELRRGAVGALYSTFTTVATFTTAGMLPAHNAKEIRLHNLARLLETAALHDSRYGGTGGADGDATLAGIIKPYGIGRLFNVTPVLVVATKRIYQLSDSAIWQVNAVKEGGYPLAFGTNRATFADLDANAPAAGAFDVCLAAGFIRLGSSPSLPITVDFIGDTQPAAPYLTRGDIARRIVTRAGTALSVGQVDSAALAALNAAKSADCGFYWDRETTKAAALSEVMAGCLGTWFVNLNGALVLGYLSAPVTSPVKTHTFGTQTGLPSMEIVQPPRWKTSVSYQRNYMVLDRSRLAGAVSDADAQLLAQDAQWKSEETATTRVKYPTSFEKRLFSGLWSGSDAQIEATAEQSLFSSPRERWRIPIYEDPFVLASYLGQRIGIAGYSRYSWNNPHTRILVAVEWGSSMIPTATLWG